MYETIICSIGNKCIQLKNKSNSYNYLSTYNSAKNYRKKYKNNNNYLNDYIMKYNNTI